MWHQRTWPEWEEVAAEAQLGSHEGIVHWDAAAESFRHFHDQTVAVGTGWSSSVSDHVLMLCCRSDQ
jgi:hypothetical protein